MPSRLRTALVGLVAATALAGCSADADPEVRIADPTASPTESAEPAPDGPPTLPPEAEGTSKAAAEAFVRHYVDTINHALATMDSTQLRVLSHRQCGACDGGASFIDRVRRRNGDISGGQYTIASSEVTRLSGAPGFNTMVGLEMKTSLLTVSGTGTRLDGESGGIPTAMGFRVLRDQGQWVLMDYWTVR